MEVGVEVGVHRRLGFGGCTPNLENVVFPRTIFTTKGKGRNKA
jgi:hypothetical protein